MLIFIRKGFRYFVAVLMKMVANLSPVYSLQRRERKIFVSPQMANRKFPWCHCPQIAIRKYAKIAVFLIQILISLPLILFFTYVSISRL